MTESRSGWSTATEFCASEYPRLVRALSLYVSDRDVAEELAQEALLRACRSWTKVAQLDSPGGWTWRVAVNLANSHFRRLRVGRRAYRRLAAGNAGLHTDPDAGHLIDVRVAISHLPERQRTAVVLRHASELSVAETARWMGVSEDAVRSLTKRAVASLRGELSPDLTVEHTARMPEVTDER